MAGKRRKVASRLNERKLARNSSIFSKLVISSFFGKIDRFGLLRKNEQRIA